MPDLLLSMLFVHGAMLWGAGLAAAPIVIHLLMRSKPRLVVFPAMRFVKMTHNANVTRHRLKHLLLLLMRAGAIAALVVVLARPKTESAARWARVGEDPVSAVVIIDTSGSMAYRVSGQPRLEEAKRLAVRLLEDLPAGSEAAVIWPDRRGDPIPLSPGTAHAVSEIRSLSEPAADARGDSLQDRPGPRAAGRRDSSKETDEPADDRQIRPGQRAFMGVMLGRAYRSLAAAQHARREIYVFNDRTRDSWSDLAGGMFRDKADAMVYLVDVGAREDQDFRLVEAKWSKPVVSTQLSPLADVTVQPGALTGRRTVELDIVDKIADSRELELADRHGRAAGQLQAAPIAQPGLYAATVRLNVPDEIVENNVRYLVLEVGPQPEVVMIVSGAAGEAAGPSVADQVRAVLAVRKRVAEGSAPIKLTTVDAANFLSRPDSGKELLARAQAVILADVGVLGNSQWGALKDYVDAGGTLITLLGPGTDPEAFSSKDAQAVLPVAAVGRSVRLEPPQVAVKPDFQAAASQVLRTYHQHDRAPTIHLEHVFQYYPQTAAQGDSEVLIRLADQARSPLLLERRLGGPQATGHSLMLLTSPQGHWSEWSHQATWPGLLYAMATAYRRDWQRVHHFTLDEPAGWALPVEFRGGRGAVVLPDNRGQVPLEMGTSAAAVTLPTRFVGHYRAQMVSPGGKTEQLLYAVNFDPAEYALEKIDPAELAGAFPPDRFLKVDDVKQLEQGQAKARAGGEEIGALLGLALLLLLIGESFFSNRFYRRPAGSPDQPPGPTLEPVAPPAPPAGPA